MRLAMPPHDLLATAAKLALLTVGVEEHPPGSNDGPEVQAWLSRVGIKTPSPWCAAWVSSIYADAAQACGTLNPCPMSASALRLWSRSPATAQVKRGQSDYVSRIKRGVVFVEDHGGGTGHCGIVMGLDGMVVHTVEANTVPLGKRSRNGYGVFAQEMRLDDPRLLGFLDFA